MGLHRPPGLGWCRSACHNPPVRLVVFLLCIPALAFAQDAVDVAQRASAAVDAHCSDIKSEADDSLAAEGVVAVGEVWAEVARAWEADGPLHLLYWRGRLASCLDQDDRARDDLTAFVEQAGDAPEHISQVAEARRRLRRLESPSNGPPPGAPMIIAGVSLLAAGGAFGGLAGW